MKNVKKFCAVHFLYYYDVSIVFDNLDNHDVFENSK